MTPDNAFLSGTRVVDLTFNRAGPSCTAMLAALGAEVIRVESLKRVDPNRMRRVSVDKTQATWGTDPTQMESTWNFNSINMGKLGVRLNLRSDGGKDVLRRLVEVSDIVVEAFSPGTLEDMGFGYDVLREWRRDVILVSVSGFGRGGPHAGYRAYADVFGAAGGIQYLTGYPDEQPMWFVGRLDSTVGAHGVFGALGALMERDGTGRGQHVDLSAGESVTTLLGGPMMDYLLNGRVASRDGNRSEEMAPHNCYRCAGEDEWVSIAVATDDEWASLCRVMERDDLATDSRFADLPARKAHEDELDAIVGEWTGARGSYEAMELLQNSGVAAVPSFNAAQLFGDSHLNERSAWVHFEHPVQGPRHDLRLPWVFSDGHGVYGPAPLMGQHNGRIYGDLLGIRSDEIAALERGEVIY
jgi:benzylsuccinate CoA-transferase BbsF subunit